ncbi:MAG TPA: archaeosortase/exosortase family protein [Thermoplasmata archaeon]|nr:archaeosortase/exosortase family protein [Thermoplasmata archaeon]
MENLRVMGFDRLATLRVRFRRTISLAALVTTFAGVALSIDRPRGTVFEWVSIPIILVGGTLLAWSMWPAGTPPVGPSTSLASRFIRRITIGGRLLGFFPSLGIAIILGDLTYNLTLSATPSIQTEDTIVLLAAVSFLVYGIVPERFARERDFVLLFFLWLNSILVVPLLVARLYYADFERSVDVYSWVALAPETGAVLNVLGVANQVHAVAGSTAPGLTFTPQHLAAQVTVVITTACSGIYSFGIFASAFAAFVLSEYNRLSPRIWLLLGLGFLTAYAANVLRMVMIVLVAYYTDTQQTDLQNMLLAHSYAGWLIFVGWIALFWTIVFKVLPREPVKSVLKSDLQIDGHREVVCKICSHGLTPLVPAKRCECGAYYHRRCIAAVERCPSCQQPWALAGPTVPEGQGTDETRS